MWIRAVSIQPGRDMEKCVLHFSVTPEVTQEVFEEVMKCEGMHSSHFSYVIPCMTFAKEGDIVGVFCPPLVIYSSAV
jgi:hypothetical protein